MIRKCTLLLAAFMGMCTAASAQLCGFDAAHAQMRSLSPAYDQKVRDNDALLAQILQNSSNSLIINTPNGPVYDIPVVIHVIHTGGAIGTIYNPHDSVLQNMITYLNQSYAATYFAYPNASSGGTAFPVQFSLAKRSPTCNATSGIVRVNGSSALGTAYTSFGVRRSGTSGIADATVKALSLWNNNDYYNIWVVNRIDGADGTSGTFVAGYAYFPGASASVDGTVMLATQAKHGKITLPHEIGHAFNLYHVFQGDDPGGTGSATTCPSTSNCSTTGDMVCDTEPMQRSPFNCPSGTNPCTGSSWQNTQKNFMDYSNCQERFTPGQRTRWMNALTTLRPSLISSLGGTAAGTPPTAAGCVPTINFSSNTLDAGIYQVTLNDMTATSEGGYNSDGNRVYMDRSCHQGANLQAGATYPVSVLTGPAREYVRVYMDYNNDGTFGSTELIFSHNGSAGSAGIYETHTGNFTVPTTGVTTCNPIRMRVVSDRFTASAAPTSCSALDYGQAEDFSVVIKPAAQSVVTINQTSGSNPSCTGSGLSFSATYTGTPASPSIKWYLNGTYTGVNSAAYGPVSTLNNGDVLTARLYYNNVCSIADSVTSAPFTVVRVTSVIPTVTHSVTAGSNPGCAGSSITFTAAPSNGGTAPAYQWYVGTAPQTGATGSSFTTTTLPCNSAVSVVMTSNASCASTNVVSSNVINYTCGTQTIGVSITTGTGGNQICQGRTMSFSATPVNGGSAPAYQWYVNGVAVSGATGASFATNTLNNGDSVHVRMTSNFSCAATPSAFSPAIQMSVVPNTTPVVTKAITSGANPGCIGNNIQFSATATNAGITPAYQWYLNGIPAGNAATFSSTTTTTGDRIWVRVVASDNAVACYTRDTSFSDTTTMLRLPVPSLPVIHFVGPDLVSDSPNVQWYGPAGIIPGATGPRYTPKVQGDYYAMIPNPLCGTGMSNVLIVSPLEVGGYNMSGLQLYPNPTNGLLHISWQRAVTAHITVYTPSGQAVLQEKATAASGKTLDMSRLASGIYFVILQDEQGQKAAVKVTLAR